MLPAAALGLRHEGHGWPRDRQKVITPFPTCPIPDVARLGRTLRQWRQQVLAYFHTSGVSSGGAEATLSSIGPAASPMWDEACSGAGPRTPKKGVNAPTGAETEGVTTNLVDPLLTILQALPAAWIEYGVVEYELRVQYPELFARHVAECGYYLAGSCRATASCVRFSTALVRLWRKEIVDHVRRPATDAWRYNGEVENWTLTPVTAGAELAWSDYATNTLHRDENWIDGDRTTVKATVAAHVAGKPPR